MLTQGNLIAVKQACVDKKHVLNSGVKKETAILNVWLESARRV